jgi:hypothetical protein
LCISFQPILWREIQELDLVSKYKNDLEFKRILKLFFNLVFCPPGEIQLSYEYIFETFRVKNYEELHNDFILYFENELSSCNIKIKPLFEQDFWNAFERILNRIHEQLTVLKHGTVYSISGLKFIILIWLD